MESAFGVGMDLTVYLSVPSAAIFDLPPCPGMADQYDQFGRSWPQCMCMTDRNTKVVDRLIRPRSLPYSLCV